LEALHDPQRISKAVHRSLLLLVMVCLVAAGCGETHRGSKRLPERASVAAVVRCLRRHHFAVKNATREALVLAPNLAPRPRAYLTFIGPGAAGVALFYSDHGRAVIGASRWDLEEQERVCGMLGKRPHCPEGIPRHEVKSTRLNVFLN